MLQRRHGRSTVPALQPLSSGLSPVASSSFARLSQLDHCLIRTSWRSRLRIWASVCLLLIATRDARAEPNDSEIRDRARALGYAGVEAYAVGDYETASAKLEQSFLLLPVPSLGLWSGRALAKLGKWVEATERFRVVSEYVVRPADPPVQQAAKLDAARELRELLGRIPRLTLQLRGATVDEVEVELDGVVLSDPEFGHSRLVNPGPHTVIGIRGTEKSQVALSIGEAGDEEVWLRFAPTAPGHAEHDDRWGDDGTRDAWRTGAWIALTGGGAGLLTGSVAYLLAQSKYSSFERRNLCVDRECSPAEVSAYDTWRTLSTVGLITGGVLTATGVAIVIATRTPAGGEARQQGLTLQVGASGAALRGDF